MPSPVKRSSKTDSDKKVHPVYYQPEEVEAIPEALNEEPGQWRMLVLLLLVIVEFTEIVQFLPC